jgi:hypothetical protein
MMMVAALAVLSIGMSGCSSGALGKVFTPNTVLISQIGFDVAVGAVCGSDTAVGKAKAASLKLVATQLLAVDTGSTAPLAALEASLQAKMATLKLPPTDQMAATVLLQVINQTIANLVQKPASSTSTTPTTTMTATVAIATVLQEVINATAAYGV